MRIPLRQPNESPFKNHFMNGGFDLWQRGLSIPSIEGKICDRFSTGYASSSGRATFSREASIIPSNGLTPYSMKAQTSIIDAAPAAGALGLLRHRIEGNYFRALKGKTFFLKGKIYTNLTGDWTIGFANAGESNRWLDQINVPVANTWTDFILDVTHNPSIGAWDYTTGAGLIVEIPLITGTSHQTSAANKRNWNTSTGWTITGSANANFHSSLSNVLYLAQLQLVTNPDEKFQRMGGSLAQEIQLCQRYFEKSYEIDTPIGTLNLNGAVISQGIGVANRPFNTLYYVVEKRATAVHTFYSPQNGNNGQLWDTQTASTHYGVASQGTGTKSFWYTPTGTLPSGGSLAAHWTADAEF